MIDDESSVESIPFAVDYERLPQGDAFRNARNEYLAKEIARLLATGAPIMRAILARPGTGQCTDEAIKVLSSGHAANTEKKIPAVRAMRDVELILRPSVQLPRVDPNGRRVSGDVLFAKVSTVGADMTANDEGIHAKDREIRQANRALFNTVEIGPDGATLPMDQAVSVLRAWGYGIAVRPKSSTRDREGTTHQNTWLVEEVPAAHAPNKEKPSK